MRHLKNEQGVAFIVEIALVAVVLVVIGAAIYESMHTKKTSATITPPTPTPTVVVSPSPSAPYLTIKELDIKLPLTDDIKDLIYVYAPAGFSGAEGRLQFSTTSITPLSNGFCSPSHEPLGAYIVYGSEQSDPSAGVLTTHIKGKFIYYTHTQYACGDTDQERAEVGSLIDPLLVAIKKAQPAQ